MKLILIRHGETYANTLFCSDQRRIIGNLDNEWTKLNEKGFAQAQKAKVKLEKRHLHNVDHVYASDISRAMQTAKIIFPNDVIHTDTRLRERSHGSLEGRLWQEVMQEKHSSLICWEKDTLEEAYDKKADDGESYRDVMERCQAFLKDLQGDEETAIAIVSHFHTLKCMLYLLQGKKFDSAFSALMIENAQPMIVTIHGNHVEIEMSIE